MGRSFVYIVETDKKDKMMDWMDFLTDYMFSLVVHEKHTVIFTDDGTQKNY